MSRPISCRFAVGLLVTAFAAPFSNTTESPLTGPPAPQPAFQFAPFDQSALTDPFHSHSTAEAFAGQSNTKRTPLAPITVRTNVFTPRLMPWIRAIVPPWRVRKDASIGANYRGSAARLHAFCVE